jgi:N,N'-diacetyllegionaminate synthase
VADKLGDTQAIKVGDRIIGAGYPAFIIAEIGMNHGAAIDMARAFIDEAAECGVDAVKFQTITASEMYAPDHPRFAVMQEREWSVATYQELKQYAADKGMVFFSTPFDEPGADVLDAAGVELFKIGSGELTSLSHLRHLAEKGKPIILSTGVADLQEVERAVRTILDAGNDQLALTYCVSLYPTPIEQANVRGIQTLMQQFGLPIGLSDHTLTISTALAGVALGACIIEKHFSVSRFLPDGDNDIAILPNEMTRMVETIREIEAGLGDGGKVVLAEEEELRPLIRRGIYSREVIASGEVIERKKLVLRRPLAEIPAEDLEAVVGCVAKEDIPAQVPLSRGSIEQV